MHRFRMVARGSALCGLIAIAALAIAACGGSHGKTTTSHGKTAGDSLPESSNVTHRSDLLTIMQADGELDTPGSQPSGTVGYLASLGATTIRTIVNWYNFAPAHNSHTEPKGFNATDSSDYPSGVWATLDGADRAAAADGVTLYVTLNGLAPLWATAPGAPNDNVVPRADRVNAEAWEPSPAQYEQWVEAVGKRYNGKYTPTGQSSPLPRIHFWSIWNEPNYGVNLAPVATDDGKVPINAEHYRALLAAGWNGLAATGHSTQTDTILIGETAPRGAAEPAALTKPAELMEPLPFIRAVYCVGTDDKPLRGPAASDIGCPTTSAGIKAFAAQNPALFKASGWADHPYPDQAPPDVNDEPPGVTGDASFANLGTLMSTLDSITGAYGQHPNFPIYNTEFGYTTKPLGYVSEATAARYMNQAEYLTWIDPRIVSYDQYQWHDPPPPRSFTTGLYPWNSNTEPKATFYAFEMPLWLPQSTAAKGAALKVWGCVRQAPGLFRSNGQPEKVEIQLSTDGGTTYETIATVTLDPAKDGCYFDTDVKFPASGLVRTTWTNSGDGAVDDSRTQAITLS